MVADSTCLNRDDTKFLRKISGYLVPLYTEQNDNEDPPRGAQAQGSRLYPSKMIQSPLLADKSVTLSAKSSAFEIHSLVAILSSSLPARLPRSYSKFRETHGTRHERATRSWSEVSTTEQLKAQTSWSFVVFVQVDVLQRNKQRHSA